MNTPTGGFATKNRLAAERSPYLQQHAANPVDWHPWGDEAFDKARREDKPVFLSIGYSACHWCHVMERESFEDEEIADVLKRHFVSIKVDREERPDLDHAYMTATQAMKGAGGRPLSVFLTGDRKPFFAGTYFPPRDVPGRMGFLTVVRGVARAWNERRPELLEQADKVVDVFHEDPPGSRSMPDEDTLGEAADELAGRFDPLYGGFSSGTKFPMGHALMFLLRYRHRTGNDESLRMVTYTLDQMAFGRAPWYFSMKPVKRAGCLSRLFRLSRTRPPPEARRHCTCAKATPAACPQRMSTPRRRCCCGVNGPSRGEHPARFRPPD